MDAAKVERVYSSYAKVYDHIFGKIFHDGREHAVRHLNLSPGERVLEVGIGTGLGLPSYPHSCEIEKVISPLCKQLGWRTDLSLASVLDGTHLTVIHKQKVNPFRIWHLVKCVNHKSTNGNGQRSHNALI